MNLKAKISVNNKKRLNKFKVKQKQSSLVIRLKEKCNLFENYLESIDNLDGVI